MARDKGSGRRLAPSLQRDVNALRKVVAATGTQLRQHIERRIERAALGGVMNPRADLRFRFVVEEYRRVAANLRAWLDEHKHYDTCSPAAHTRLVIMGRSLTCAACGWCDHSSAPSLDDRCVCGRKDYLTGVIRS